MNMSGSKRQEGGATLIELVISILIIGTVTLSLFSLFISLTQSAVIAKHRSIATTLATNQVEYLKGLPYDSLAVQGGSIYATNPLPSQSTHTLNKTTYTVRTSINYIDDAYDGCASYPTQALKNLYCRNLPSPATAPAVDTNPRDYKVVHVSVLAANGAVLSEVDTQIAARVAETASTTGAMFISVIDDSGNPISGATVRVTNSTVSPAVDLSDNSDGNGIAILYGLPPDSGNDYVIRASKDGYSTLSTIAPSGSLQPTYPNQRIVAQQSSSVTLTLRPKYTPSMAIEAVDLNGNPIPNLRLYVKGGYKRFTVTTDTSYYYDNFTPDTRPATDGAGTVVFSDLTPGSYIFCGDAGATGCSVAGTTYYLVSAMQYTGENSLYPVKVPINDPLVAVENYSLYGLTYPQRVRLVLSTSANTPRVHTVSPSEVSIGGGTIGNQSIQLTGSNLPCSANAASCSTTVQVVQNANTYTASCVGAATGTTLDCTVNLTGISQGDATLRVTANGQTVNLPMSSPRGGIYVAP
jgi:type II secretory pathway pseudopilin PulG